MDLEPEELNVGCASAIDGEAWLENRFAQDEVDSEEYAVAANPPVDALHFYHTVLRPILEQGGKPSAKEVNFDMDLRRFFTISAKLEKSIDYGWYTPGLHLSPSTSAFPFGPHVDTCPFASQGCRMGCLVASGQRILDSTTQLAPDIAEVLATGEGRLSPSANTTMLKTWLYQYNRPKFMATLSKAIKYHRNTAKNAGLKYAIRLNATSDIAWERTGIMQEFPDVTFYDYTKIPQRALDFAKGKMPKNYYLCFSYSEINMAWALIMLQHGVNVVVPFDLSLGLGQWSFAPEGKRVSILPTTFMGRPVVDGDASDARFLDNEYWPQHSGANPPLIIGLRIKGTYQKRAPEQNAFFFPAIVAQSHGEDIDYLAKQLFLNTAECVRQKAAGQLPPQAMVDALGVREFSEAFRAGKNAVLPH